MKNIPLSNVVRLTILLSGIILIFVLFIPIWKIELAAPQYPEGLTMFINANGLGGNIDIINGLNHYIGMKTLHNEDFIEFKILPYLISIFALFFILVAILKKRKLMYVLFASFVLFGTIAMIDFWRWEYNYGHNLDPHAAIIVPGMAYQPPLIGYKQLLNFGAYSVPHIGGWLFIIAGALLLLCIIFDHRHYRKVGKLPSIEGLGSSKNSKVNVTEKKRKHTQKDKVLVSLLSLFHWRFIFAKEVYRIKGSAVKKTIFRISPVSLISLIVLSITGCSAEPQPIKIGADNCHYCKMTIIDKKYSAEVITKKGKIFKYDDSHCLFSEISEKGIDRDNIKDIYFADFCDGHELIKSQNNFYLRSQSLKAPMNGNIAAFSSHDSLSFYNKQLGGEEVLWNQLMPVK